MAEVNVEKTRSEDRERQGSQALEHRQRSGMAQRGDAFPSLLFRNPSDLFSMNPFALMRHFNEEMNRGFGDTAAQIWSPAVDISERDGKLMVHADLPGLKQDDVKVEVIDDQLIIQGERKREHEENRQGFRRSERSYGSFYRSIPLPEGANVDQTQAQFNNGVLEVSIPVPEEQHKRRQIPIGTGTQNTQQKTQQNAPQSTQPKGQTGETTKTRAA